VRKTKIKRLATRKPREEIMSQKNQEDTVINIKGSSICVPSQIQPPLQNHDGLQWARSTLHVFLSCIQPFHCFFCFISYLPFFYFPPYVFIFFNICIFSFQLISHCSPLFVEGSKGEIMYYHKDQKPCEQRSRLWNVQQPRLWNVWISKAKGRQPTETKPVE
jgi:hypothetical protein